MASAERSPTDAPQQYNLKWTNHTNNILQVFAEHLMYESLVDVTLSCEGHFIKAHKMMLSACSPYFNVSNHKHVNNSVILLIYRNFSKCTQKNIR